MVKDKVRGSKKDLPMRFKRNRYKEVVSYVKEQLEETQVDKLFTESGLHITTIQYQIYRHLVFVALIMLLIYASVHSNYIPLNNLAMIVVLYIATIPAEKILGRATPLKLALNLVIKEFKEQKDLEIYRSISQLKNLAIAQQDNPYGADFILEQLSKFSNLTKSAYIKALSLWRVGKEKEAIETFGNEVDTRLARDFGNTILLKLDELNPVEFKEQLENFQNIVKNERITERQKKNEFISNILFTPALVSALLILLNFVIVVIFIDQLNMLKNIN